MLKSLEVKRSQDNIVEKDKQKSKNNSLDDYQNAAIHSKNKKLLIVAGPGSGKTTVLTRRIAYMISQNNVLPQNCLAITFTRRAAMEMKQRLLKLLQEKARLIHIHTFHSLCFSILKENYHKLGLNENIKVISSQEKGFKETLAYDRDTLEFDDLITLCIKLFEQYPDVLKIYSEKRFKYISIDEYQDIDKNQYKLIKLLAPTNYDGNLCAIGDPNQAIYGFRGSDSTFFNNFTQDYQNVEVINLKNNYRSNECIVNASNQILDTFNIVSQSNMPEEKITIHTAVSEKAEAKFIVKTIDNLIGGQSFFSIDSNRTNGQESNYSFSDFAILYRTSSQLKPLVNELKHYGMPFATLSDDLLCDKKVIQNLLKNLIDSKEESILQQLNRLYKEKFQDQIENYIYTYLQQIATKHCAKNDFIHEVCLLRESDTFDPRADRISLMTLHASKGLEFKCVFISGLENGIIPLYKATSQKEIEEERRLLYVGMTRAKERLFLTRALKRQFFGTFKNLEVSPFLQKIELDLLNLSKYKKKSIENEKLNQLTLF